jgi:NAD(P)-dependent dehydrogenase (short-subunit alcohol dehydrogenase family)
VAAAVSKAVLVTGCSSGIGAATAERLRRAGWTVYATARRPQTLDSLAALGCRTLQLDVCDEASMAAAVAEVERDCGAVGVLVNNAGYGQDGAVEEVPIELVRKQFETNVFGLMRMCQLVLPGMRRQRWGRIVNVGSMGGRLTFPGGGAYHATKHAVEAISDALRFEVAGFGVRVSLIEPGMILTRFGDTVVESLPGDGAHDDGPYAGFHRAVARRTADAYTGTMAKLAGAPPDTVARVIEKAVGSRRPRSRYPVTAGARLMMGVRSVLPDRAFDAMLATQFPRPK